MLPPDELPYHRNTLQKTSHPCWIQPCCKGARLQWWRGTMTKVPLVRWDPAPRMDFGSWKLAGQEQAQESQAGWQKNNKIHTSFDGMG